MMPTRSLPPAFLPHRLFRAICRLALPLLLVFSVLPSARAEEPVTLRVGTLLPSGTAQYTELQAMFEQWRKVSGGSVKVILYPDGRLGGESEMVKKMRIKQLNAAVLTVVGLSEIDQAAAGLQLMPLLFHTWDEVDAVREKLRPLLEERLRAKGYEVLFWADAGWVHFFSKTAAVRPSEFQQMKVFTWSGDIRQSEIMKSVGYRPVSLETSDIVMGLNTDMINAVPLPSILALAGQLYGPAPHMLNLNWSPVVGAAVVRRDVWEKLSPALQQQFRASAEALGVKERAISRREDEESLKAMQAHGLAIHEVPADALAQWSQLSDTLLARVRGNLVPADIFDEVQRALADYRRQSVPVPK